jgi:hypothetical protein
MKMQIRVVSHDSCRYLNFQVITDGHEDHLIDGVSRCPAVAFTAILVVFDVALDALLQMSLLCCRNESDAGNSLTDGDSCGKFTASDVAVQNVSIAADEAFPQSIRIQMNGVHILFSSDSFVAACIVIAILCPIGRYMVYRKGDTSCDLEGVFSIL